MDDSHAPFISTANNNNKSVYRYCWKPKIQIALLNKFLIPPWNIALLGFMSYLRTYHCGRSFNFIILYKHTRILSTSLIYLLCPICSWFWYLLCPIYKLFKFLLLGNLRQIIILDRLVENFVVNLEVKKKSFF